MYIGPGEAWEYCPREALRRVSRILKNEFDLVRKINYIVQVSFQYSLFIKSSDYIYIYIFIVQLYSNITSSNYLLTLLNFLSCVQEMKAGFEIEFLLLKRAVK